MTFAPKYFASKGGKKLGVKNCVQLPKQEFNPWVEFHLAIYALRLKYALCAHLFTLI
jgi:hypothetical protein